MKHYAVVCAMLLASCASSPSETQHTQPAANSAIQYAPGANPESVIKPPIVEELEAHPGDAWYSVRAAGLNASLEQARARDRSMHFAGPPAGFWDPQLARETWSVWTMLCNECHGGTRSVDDVLAWKSPSAGFKDQNAMFFLKERPASEVYDVIFHGARNQKGGEDMPAWGANNMLSREQIWGLVYFVRAETKRNRVY